MKRALAGLLLLATLASAAALHRLRTHPPSPSTIASLAEGPDGLLWVATGSGLYRFDGFRYWKISGYPFTGAQVLAVGPDGTVWAGGAEGLARLARGGRAFQVVLRESVVGAFPLGDSGVVLNCATDRVALAPDGSLVSRQSRRLDHSPGDGTGIPWVDATGGVWYACGNAICKQNSVDSALAISAKTPFRVRQLARDGTGWFWLLDGLRAVAWQDGRAGKHHDPGHSDTRSWGRPMFIPGPMGEVWFLGTPVRGLVSSTELRDRPSPGNAQPYSGYADPAGRFWAAYPDNRLLQWSIDPHWQRWFPEDFGGKAPVQVTRDGRGRTLVVSEDGLFSVNADGSTSPFGSERGRYAYLQPLRDGTFLASIRGVGPVALDTNGHRLQHLPVLVPKANADRQILQDREGRIWLGNKRALFRVTGEPGTYELHKEQLPGVSRSGDWNPVDLELDSLGRLWVGYQDGLAWLGADGRWNRIATSKPVLEVRSFGFGGAVRNGDEIWVAYRRSGAFSRLLRQGAEWKVTDFTMEHGYGPPDTHFLKVDSRGWIWRGTPDGVWISDGVHNSPDDWLHLHEGNGLAGLESAQYGFFEDPAAASVWIVMEEGLTHLRPDAAWFATPNKALPPPVVSQVTVDGNVPIPELPNVIDPAPRQLRIEFGSLHSPPFRAQPFQYRLPSRFDDWRTARDGAVELADLSRGAYTLEVRYAGVGESAVMRYPFHAGPLPAPFPWSMMGAALAGLAALALGVRRLPIYEKLAYRAAKSAFVLRKRLGGRVAGEDLSGALLAGRYRILHPVSRGGFSVVYAARDEAANNARVAVKALTEQTAGAAWVRNRFGQEVAALHSVRHPGVVTLLDSWIHSSGEPCLAMPFLDGPTLRQALADGPLDPARAARVIQKLGEAVAEIHRRGVIHRDLKPENILLTQSGEQPVLVDFGTAGMLGAAQGEATTSLIAGSGHYMAPERFTGHYSPGSDVYSLGVIALEMITGSGLAGLESTLLSRGFGGELTGAMAKVMGPVDAPAAAALLIQAFAVDPKDRPADAGTWTSQLAAMIAPVSS